MRPLTDAVNNELTSIQSLVKKNDGIRILTTYMANPPVTFEQKISVEVYNVLTQRGAELQELGHIVW